MARMRFDSTNFNAEGRQSDSTAFGGYSSDVAKGRNILGTNVQDYTDKYRSMADAAAARQAYQADFSGANADIANAEAQRASQVQAAGMLGDAARGNAPSQAAILGQGAAGQSLQSALQTNAGARGGMAQAAAQAQTARAQQQAQLAGIGQFGNARAGELTQARNAYQQGAMGIRQGDYQAQGMLQQQAEAMAQSEMGQRQLNQQAQMANEQRAWDVRKQDQDRYLRQKQVYGQQYATDSGVDNARQDANMALAGATVGAAGAGMSSAMKSGGSGDLQSTPDPETGSDERMKSDVVPLTNTAAGELHADDRGAFYAKPPSIQDMTGGASMVGSDRPSLAKAVASRGARREMNADDLSAWADRETAKTKQQTADLDKASPAVSDMGHALAKGLAPFEYSYRPEFAANERQTPGEKNVGPMAQDMASNPVTASAVRHGPDGLLYIDNAKALKLSLGAAGYLAAQQKQQEQRLAQLERKR